MARRATKRESAQNFGKRSTRDYRSFRKPFPRDGCPKFVDCFQQLRPSQFWGLLTCCAQKVSRPAHMLTIWSIEFILEFRPLSRSQDAYEAISRFCSVLLLEHTTRHAQVTVSFGGCSSHYIISCRVMFWCERERESERARERERERERLFFEACHSLSRCKALYV